MSKRWKEKRKRKKFEIEFREIQYELRNHPGGLCISPGYEAIDRWFREELSRRTKALYRKYGYELPEQKSSQVE